MSHNGIFTQKGQRVISDLSHMDTKAMFRTRVPTLLITLFFVVVGTILFLANVNKEFGHDEHLYVAGGALISKSFMPYKDFPYLNMPYLAFAYGVLFRFTDHLLLAARALSTIGGLLTLAILFTIAFNLKMFNYIIVVSESRGKNGFPQ